MRITIIFETKSDAFTENFHSAVADAMHHAKQAVFSVDPQVLPVTRNLLDWNGNHIGTVIITPE